MDKMLLRRFSWVAIILILGAAVSCKPNPGTGEEVGKKDLYRTGADNPVDPQSENPQSQTKPSESNPQSGEHNPDRHP